LKSDQYPTMVNYFGLAWLESKENSSHVLWIRWNRGDRLGFLQQWEAALALLDARGLVKPEVIRTLKNSDQFLDTIAQVEIASVLITKGFEIELEAKKSGKTPDIFLIREGICVEVKNLHIDAALLEQTLTESAEVVQLKERLPSAVEEKYNQLPEGCPNILVVVAPPEVQFDEFEDFFIDIPTTLNLETGEITRGKPKGFFYQERLDGTKIHTKLSAVIMWKDQVRKYLTNSNANIIIPEELLQRISQ
jgi:hypothetical protein